MTYKRNPTTRNTGLFEPAATYKHEGRTYLALTCDLLLTRRGKFWEITKPSEHYQILREFSTNDLLAVWKVSIEEIDRLTSRYLSPLQRPGDASPTHRTHRRKYGNRLSLQEEVPHVDFHKILRGAAI